MDGLRRVGYLGRSGVHVICIISGFILLTRQPDETFLMGLYFTHPEYRGLGIGTSVFDACFAAVKDKGAVRLSTRNMKHIYPIKGFVYRGSERVQTTGYAHIKEGERFQELWTQSLLDKGVCIRRYAAKDFDKLGDYDSKICGISRASVLQVHLKFCVSALVAFSGGELVGYVTTQQHSEFVHIRPLYADNDTIASALVKSVLHSLEPGTPILINCPLGNRQQFWKEFGISSAERTSLSLTNKPADEPNRDGVYSHYNSWYMTMWRTRCVTAHVFNSLRPSDAIWRHRSGSTLAQVMACCLTAPSHYPNQSWLIISKV